MTETLWKE
jgi:hypothetical protein